MKRDPEVERLRETLELMRQDIMPRCESIAERAKRLLHAWLFGDVDELVDAVFPKVRN